MPILNCLKIYQKCPRKNNSFIGMLSHTVADKNDSIRVSEALRSDVSRGDVRRPECLACVMFALMLRRLRMNVNRSDSSSALPNGKLEWVVGLILEKTSNGVIVCHTGASPTVY